MAEVLSAIALREPLNAPGLLAYEIGNVIHRKRRAAVRKNLAERAAFVRELLALVEMGPADEEAMQTTGRLCERTGISFYDSAYLALAMIERHALLTADRGLHEHAKALGLGSYLWPDDRASILSDFSPTDPS